MDISHDSSIFTHVPTFCYSLVCTLSGTSVQSLLLGQAISGPCCELYFFITTGSEGPHAADGFIEALSL